MKRILVAGFGSIAKRHIRNLKTLDPDFEVAVWRQSTSPREIDPQLKEYVGAVFLRREEVSEFKPEAALITNPAPCHVDSALFLAGLGSHLLIEKPLSHNLDGLDGLIELCRSRRLCLAVAYNFRHYGPLRKAKALLEAGNIGTPLLARAQIGQYLPDWRPTQDYRECVSARRQLGGGVLLELSHEIDYVRWLMGEVHEVTAVTGKISRLEIDVEDHAELILGFKGGAKAQIHLDMLDRMKNRSLRIIGSEGTLFWDGLEHSVGLFNGKSVEVIAAAGDTDLNDMYIEELRSFLRGCRDGSQPMASPQDAKRVLEIIAAARQSALKGEKVVLPDAF